MVDKELLTAISGLLDEKFDQRLLPMNGRLERLEEDMKYVKFSLEKIVVPRIDGLDSRLDKVDSRLDKVESRLDKVENDVKYISVVQLENNVIPRLDRIEECYLDAAKGFRERAEQLDTMAEDIQVLTNVVTEHSEKLNKLCV